MQVTQVRAQVPNMISEPNNNPGVQSQELLKVTAKCGPRINNKILSVGKIHLPKWCCQLIKIKQYPQYKSKYGLPVFYYIVL